MPSTAELPSLDLPRLAPLLSALSEGDFQGVKLAELRQRVERGRAALDYQANHFDAWFQEIVQSPLHPEDIEYLAEVTAEKAQAAAKVLNPQIETLEQILRTRPELRDSDIFSVVREHRDIAAASIALLRTLHNGLLALAADRRAAAEKIRHAHPVSGEVDHEALSREFMARFPKIRAALAK